MQIETIKINDDGERGYKTINKCDFDEKIHTVYGEKPTKKKTVKKVSNDNN